MKKRVSKKAKKPTGRKLLFPILSIILILLFIFIYVFSNMPMWGSHPNVHENTQSVAEKSAFTIEGRLRFYNEDEQPVTAISVEIADDAYSREKGMMYRYYIPDTVGMLFIFPKEDHRFFWMKDTPASLDILYADKDFRIIRIHENTEPYSMKSIPSGDKAKYVIEVKAGFVARNQIRTGFRFSYETLQ